MVMMDMSWSLYRAAFLISMWIDHPGGLLIYNWTIGVTSKSIRRKNDTQVYLVPIIKCFGIFSEVGLIAFIASST